MSAQILHNVVITYFVNISPTVPIILTGSTSSLLKFPYNIEYNLSITAATPCRNNATTFRILKYGENNNMDFPEILVRTPPFQDTMHGPGCIKKYTQLPLKFNKDNSFTSSCPKGIWNRGILL